MGAVERDRERRKGRDSRYVLWVSNDSAREKNGKEVRAKNVEVLRQNERILGEEKCERILEEKSDCDFKEACSCWHRAWY